MATEYRTETIFTWGAPPLKFGVGALDELGFDLGQMGLSRVLIVTDEGVAATGVPQRAAESMQNAGLKPAISAADQPAPARPASRAAIQRRLPEMVLISPLWATTRKGWARGQVGKVLVL